MSDTSSNNSTSSDETIDIDSPNSSGTIDDDSSRHSTSSADSSTGSGRHDSLLRLCTLSLLLSERETKYHRARISWDNHALMLVHEQQFDAKYRMPFESFSKLLKILEPQLARSDTMSIISCGQLPVSPGHILGLTIRWLSGGSFHDIRDAGNFSKPTFYRLLWLGLISLIKCPQLQIALPETEDELDELRGGFAAKSTEGAMSGCVGALDGFLLLIRTPTRKEAANSRLFFSGHYSRMGLNVQAMCDVNLRFIYMAILAPGKSSDVQAYRKSKLEAWIEQLPPWYFVTGDNAYVCTEHLLTPFCGSSRFNPEFDAYNF